MTYTREDVAKHMVWKHLKSGGIYFVYGISTCSTNGDRDGKEEVVVYLSLTYQKLRHRDLTEFLDGRFIPVEAAIHPQDKLGAKM